MKNSDGQTLLFGTCDWRYRSMQVSTTLMHELLVTI